MFLIAWDFSFHSVFFHSHGGVIIDDKRLKKNCSFGTHGHWVLLKHGTENGTDHPLIRTDDADVLYIHHKVVI